MEETFGTHRFPFKIGTEDFSISVEKETNSFIYKRERGKDKIEKILLVDSGEMLINPVEPVNLPKKVTTHLLVEFDKTVLVGPKEKKNIILSFPVEIGVFLTSAKGPKMLDVFSLVEPKYTLYGHQKKGVLCRYWKSEVYIFQPEFHPFYKGVLELIITNTTSRWFELTKVVLNVYGMRIYYSPQLVSVKAEMKITRLGIAEVVCRDTPLKKGMKKSVEIYTSVSLPGVQTKFLMEEGL